MKLSELIEHLETIADELAHNTGDSDPEVMIAYQPNYPLAVSIETVSGTFNSSDSTGENAPAIWIASGGADHSRSPYAPHEAWGSEYGDAVTDLDNSGDCPCCGSEMETDSDCEICEDCRV